MKKRIIIAVLVTVTQIALAGDNGWKGHEDRYEKGYRQPVPRGNAYGHYRHPNRPFWPVYQPVVQQCAPLPMANRDFADLRLTIHRAAFESTKLNIFRQALAFNYFTTAQVMDLMDLFYFDSSRLELAKMAYNKTVDPQRYYLVNGAFTFSSSARELGDYLAMR